MNVLHFLILLSVSCSSGVRGARNITVDDPDLSIRYTGTWSTSVITSLDVGNSHQLTEDPIATASFTFTGVAVYFMSPLWPYLVNTAVSLDSGPILLIDLVDHSQPDKGDGSETVQSHVVWGQDGLENREHNLLISVGRGQPYAIVDALVYTVEDDGDTTSPSTSTRPTSPTSRNIPSATSASASASGASSKVLPIALGTALGVLAAILFLVALWFCCRRKKRPESGVTTSWAIDDSTGHPSPGPIPPASLPFPRPSHHVSPYHGDNSHAHLPDQGYAQSAWPYSQQGMTPPIVTVTPIPEPTLRAQDPHPGFHGNSGVHHTAGPIYQGGGTPNSSVETEQLHSRSSNRYQANTLSTITESSILPNGAAAPRPLSSYHTEMSSSGGNSDRTSSVLSPTRPDSAYRQYSYGRNEKEGLSARAAMNGGPSEQGMPPPPPAYNDKGYF